MLSPVSWVMHMSQVWWGMGTKVTPCVSGSMPVWGVSVWKVHVCNRMWGGGGGGGGGGGKVEQPVWGTACVK